MTEHLPLLTLGSFEITPYIMCTAFSVLAGLVFYLISAKSVHIRSRIIAAVLSIPIGLICARLFYVLSRFSFFQEIGFGQAFYYGEGMDNTWGGIRGAALWGAAGGTALALLIAAKLTREKAADMMDSAAPAAALVIALYRLCEYSGGEGIGPMVENELLKFFPLAVPNEYNEWYYSVFLLEALAAFVIFVMLLTKFRSFNGGYRARIFLVMFCSSQILLESLRRDNYLRWLFVRVSMLTAAILTGAMLIAALIRRVRHPEDERMPLRRAVICIAIALICTALVILVEFALDKTAELDNAVGYLLEAVFCAVFGFASGYVIMNN